MNKYSPGPWFYDDGEGGKYFPHVVLGGNDPKSGEYITVNTTRGRNGGQMSECQANARLIACAPEMGEMLLSAYVHVSHGGPTREQVEALLKKAGLLTSPFKHELASL